MISLPERSFFLFGPRGTGKSSWVQGALRDAVYLDLLGSDTYFELLASPQRLEARLGPEFRGWVIIDEVQKVPALLDEVHRLIERRRLRFALTGSSARKLRRKGVNLLAGRALTMRMHPLTSRELGSDFDVRWSLRYGNLPSVQVTRDEKTAAGYLAAYVRTYLQEEVQQERLTRNLGAFARFLEAASFSQAQVLSVASVARDCHVDRKVAEDYFGILEDLLLATKLPVFTRRAKRKLVAHPKFFFFDVGVFRTVRPRGPLDSADEIDGAALETLVLEELRAVNDGLDLGYEFHYWRTAKGSEVDFVLYGQRGLIAIEVKRTQRLRPDDYVGLQEFLDEYPVAKAYMIYGGTTEQREGKIRAFPIGDALRRLPDLI